jgi:DNA-binding NarL/FixJ family response regulator
MQQTEGTKLMKTMSEVATLHKRYVKTSNQAKQILDERDESICQLAESGTRMAAIARELNVTRGRIAQIVSRG